MKIKQTAWDFHEIFTVVMLFKQRILVKSRGIVPYVNKFLCRHGSVLALTGKKISADELSVKTQEIFPNNCPYSSLISFRNLRKL